MKKLIAPIIEEAEVRCLREAFMAYRDAKRTDTARMRENEDWFEGNYWKHIKKREGEMELDPTTPFLFNAVWNKHADAIDNFPEPIFLEREEQDREEAARLTKIIPLAMEQGGFKDAYSQVEWEKPKMGTGIYGVFWDKDAENGLGEIKVSSIDPRRIYTEPLVEDIQKSRYIFIPTLVDRDLLEQRYPELAGNPLSDQAAGRDAFGEYGEEALRGKVVVLDCYERFQRPDGRWVVHLTKLCGDIPLYSTKSDPLLALDGLYSHGMYPFIPDRFIPKKDSLWGIGLIDLGKSMQSFIDISNYLIDVNNLESGQPRFFYSDALQMDIEKLTDMQEKFVPFCGTMDESKLMHFQASPISQTVVQNRDSLIAYLKEIVGNRDFNQGGAMNGVTAYSAIAALQEAGSKLSRDQLSASYESFRQVVYMVVELVRQFYTEERCFRITGKGGQAEYIAYSGENLRDIPIPDPLGGEESRYRRAVFDIQVVPQRKNPFNTIAHNQPILDLYKMGALHPQNADAAILALENMILDNKEGLIAGIRRNAQLIAERAQTEAEGV